MNVLTRIESIVVMLIAFAAAIAAADDMKFHGQVVSTAGGQLTLMAAGELVRFTVDVDTNITLDGQESTLENLTPDHVADVAAQRRGDDWIATKIEARSQKIVAASTLSPTIAVQELLFQGKFTEVDGGELTLITDEGTVHLFATTAKTLVTIDGEKAQVGDLQTGFAAEVIAEKSGDLLTAIAVNATSQR